MWIKSIYMRVNKKLIYIILGALTIAALLITISFYQINDASSKGMKLSNFFDSKKPDIFKAIAYEANYTAHIVSNKNSHEYQINEKYERKAELENFSFVLGKDDEPKIQYQINNNTLTLKSENEALEYTLSEYVVKKENPLSLSTFLEIYKTIEQNNEHSSNCIKIELEELEDTRCYRVILGNQKEEMLCDSCKQYQTLKASGISKLELIISKKTDMPVEYIIYNPNNEGYIDINYQYFSIIGDF